MNRCKSASQAELRYLASYIYGFLLRSDCVFEGDSFVGGQGWITADAQVFMLPEPELVRGSHWFDADVLEDIIRDRWLGFTFQSLRRYPD